MYATRIILAAIALLFLAAQSAPAAETQNRQEELASPKPVIQAQSQLRNPEQIYGSQLMTEEERRKYRIHMREARSEAERERIRAEHHEQMKERARVKGITLPDEPPDKRGKKQMKGKGMGQGGGGRR